MGSSLFPPFYFLFPKGLLVLLLSLLPTHQPSFPPPLSSKTLTQLHGASCQADSSCEVLTKLGTGNLQGLVGATQFPLSFPSFLLAALISSVFPASFSPYFLTYLLVYFLTYFTFLHNGDPLNFRLLAMGSPLGALIHWFSPALSPLGCILPSCQKGGNLTPAEQESSCLHSQPSRSLCCCRLSRP